MTQPTSYTPTTDFSADELANTGGRSTVRTAELDAEFSGIAATLSGVLTNLALNQRDDGEVRDERVKLPALGADVKTLLAAGQGLPRGAWLTATAYALRDVVASSGNTYICATAHTSGVFATDLAAVKWLLLSLGAATAASAVPFTPTATISATDVQAAIVETDTENRVLSAAALAAATTVVSNLASSAVGLGSKLVAFIQRMTGAVSRWVEDKLAETKSIADFGAVGDSATNNTAAIQACHDALPDGGTMLIPAASGHYLFTQITITKSITIKGQGYMCSIKELFGNAGYLLSNASGVMGSVLRSTLTTANAAITCTTINRGPRFESLAILGPGSGTSRAMDMGSFAAYQIVGQFTDVMFANFYQGVSLKNVEDYTFSTLRIRGMSDYGLLLASGGAGVNTTQDVFVNTEIQKCGIGLYVTEAAGCIFYGGLLQGNTVGLKLAPSAAGRIGGLGFNKIWFETNTTDIVLDLTSGGIEHLTFDGCIYQQGGNFFSLTNPSNNTVNWLTLLGNSATSKVLDLSPGASVGPAYARVTGVGNEFSSIVPSNATNAPDIMDFSGSAVYDPPNLADGAGTTTTVTVTGAALGDYAQATFSLDLQGITVSAWVSAANTVSVRFQNESGGALDLASGTLRAKVVKV